MKKTVTYLTLLLFILFSCAKDGKRIFVEGKVLNPNTGEGIEGATIKIMKNALSGGFKILKEYKTGADGTFAIGVNSIAIDVYVKCDDGFGNYNIGWDLDFEADIIDLSTFRIPKKGKVYQADYHTVPEGKIRMNYKNINCYDANDKIAVYAQTKVGSISPSIPPQVQLGCTSILYGEGVVPSGEIYYHYFVTKNNLTTEHFDTLYVYPNQENTHVIEY